LLRGHVGGAGPAVRQGPRHGGLLLPGEVRHRPLRRAHLRPAREARRVVLADDLHAAVVPLRPRGAHAHVPAGDGGAREHQGGVPQGAGGLRRPGDPLRDAVRVAGRAQAGAEAALRGPARRGARADDGGDGEGRRRRVPRAAGVQRPAPQEVARGARVVRARGSRLPDRARAAGPHGSGYRPRDRGGSPGLRLSNPVGPVLSHRRRPDALGVRSRPGRRRHPLAVRHPRRVAVVLQQQHERDPVGRQGGRARAVGRLRGEDVVVRVRDGPADVHAGHADARWLGPGALSPYFAFWRVPVDPVAWTPPPAPGYGGPFARNDRLAAMERLSLGADHGPEAVALDAAGRIYTSTREGRILRLRPDGSGAETYADTNGAPLGLHFDASGTLIVADAMRGLLRITPDRRVTVLATEADGTPIAYADDLDVARDGRIYFSDASTKFGARQG